MSIIFETENGRKREISDVVISTAFGQNGRGMFTRFFSAEYRRLLKYACDKNITIFSKSSTRYPRVGNFRITNPFTWKYIQKISDRSMLNAYGLTNRGVEINAKDIAVSCGRGFKVIPNYYPEFEKGGNKAIIEIHESVLIYEKYLGNDFWALELNASCPNSKEDISKNMDMVIKCVDALKLCYEWLTIVVKTSIVHPYGFYKRLEDAGADIIHSTNTIPFRLVFPDRVSPFIEKGGGGVSGEEAFELSFNYNKELKKYTKLPVIMGCGVTDIFSKVMFIKYAGADSVSICSIALMDSKEACRIVAPVDKSWDNQEKEEVAMKD